MDDSATPIDAGFVRVAAAPRLGSAVVVVFAPVLVLGVFLIGFPAFSAGLQCYTINDTANLQCKAINTFDPNVKTCDIETCEGNQTNCKRVTVHSWNLATQHFHKYTYLIGCTDEVVGKEQLACTDKTRAHDIHDGKVGNLTCLCSNGDLCNAAATLGADRVALPILTALLIPSLYRRL